MTILLVEDDLPLGSSLQRVLSAAGHPTTWVRDAVQARAFLAEREAFELILLDIVLPGESGLQLLDWIRDRADGISVMMLTTRGTVADRVAGLDGGADDYLPKPFAMEELLSRVRVLLRRRHQQLTARWRIGSLEIDTARRRVCVAGTEVEVTAREFDILCVLAGQAGKVVTREQFERACWPAGTADSNVVDVHVYQLRKKIGAGLIATVRGIGYVLEVPHG